MKVDLVFLVDSSGSILPSEYQSMKDFIKLVVQRNGLSEHGIHAGVVLFSSAAEVAIKLNDFYDTRSFLAAVQSLDQLRASRFMDKALFVAYNQLLTKDFGARPTVPKVMLILTHGKHEKANDGIDLRVAAMPLRKENVFINAIGIGRMVERKELETITGNTESVYTVRNFKLLPMPQFIHNFDFECSIGKLINVFD